MTARVALLLALLTLFACSSDALIAQADATPPAAAHVPASSPATNVTIEHHCEEQPLLPSSDAATGPDVTLQDAGAPDALAEATVDAAPDVITGASPLPPRVFVYGNSLVFGSGMTQPAITTDRFPAQLAAKLGTKWVSDLWIGRGGWPTSMLITAARHDLAVANAEPPRTRKVLVFWEGVNEMGSPYNCEAYEIMTRRRVEEGWTVVLITATPTAATADKTVDGGATAPYWPTLRHTFNACVRSNAASWGAAAVVDVEAIPELNNPFDSTYYLDTVHLSKAGYALVADAVAPVVESLYIAP